MPGKKFRFGLQNVLKLRRHKTERARQALTSAKQALTEKKEQLEQARAHLAKCQRTVEEGEVQRSAQLRQAGAFRENARQSVADARAAVEECRERVREAEEKLHETRQDEEAFVELRDQKKEQHDREQAKAEVAFFDEQAVLRHARSSSTSLMQDL